jgi:hypothetical protein
MIAEPRADAPLRIGLALDIPFLAYAPCLAAEAGQAFTRA